MPSSNKKTCSWVDERIDLFIDDELSQDESAALSGHIEECKGCAEDIAFARSMLAELHALPEHRCPGGVVSRAASEIEHRSLTIGERVGAWIDTQLSTLLRPAMAAMVVIAVVVGVFVMSQRGSINKNDTMTAEAASNEVKMAFAYVGKYTMRADKIFREDVMGGRVVPAMDKAMRESGSSAFSMGIMPAMGLSNKTVTNKK